MGIAIGGRDCWQLVPAKRYKVGKYSVPPITKDCFWKFSHYSNDEKIIWLSPSETILAHTNEFIGGRSTVTTMMKARSSLGRNFIEICKCAGWGDIGTNLCRRSFSYLTRIFVLGYVNRWTMEITNNSRHYSVPLVVGRRVAQIVFFDSEGTENTSYEITGKYQTSSDLQKVMDNWTPDEMLPKMYKDREVRNLNGVSV